MRGVHKIGPLVSLMAVAPALADPPRLPGSPQVRTEQTELADASGSATVSGPHSDHVHLRGPLNNSRITFSRAGRGSVAFIGGSITEMDGYRPLVCEFLGEHFPDTEFTFTNAGISSTCSTTGSFRLSRDVLAADPDLLFIEFAVNDDQDAVHAARECVRGMEGIVRQARRHDPDMDIVITYFVNPPMLELLRDGQIPISIDAHESVARHYRIAGIDLAAEVAERMDRGLLSWTVYGGTHPKPAGNRIAADMIRDLLLTAWSEPLDAEMRREPHAMPEPLDRGSYFRGRLVAIDRAESDANWHNEIPDWDQIQGTCRTRFRQRRLLCSTEPGARTTLEFSGTAVGAYLLAGPDAASIEVSIDDGEPQTIDLFHRFSKGLHYPRTVVFAGDLDDGPHRLTLTVSDRKHPDRTGNAVRILDFVAN